MPVIFIYVTLHLKAFCSSLFLFLSDRIRKTSCFYFSAYKLIYFQCSQKVSDFVGVSVSELDFWNQCRGVDIGTQWPGLSECRLLNSKEVSRLALLILQRCSADVHRSIVGPTLRIEVTYIVWCMTYFAGSLEIRCSATERTILHCQEI